MASLEGDDFSRNGFFFVEKFFFRLAREAYLIFFLFQEAHSFTLIALNSSLAFFPGQGRFSFNIYIIFFSSRLSFDISLVLKVIEGTFFKRVRQNLRFHFYNGIFYIPMRFLQFAYPSLKKSFPDWFLVVKAVNNRLAFFSFSKSLINLGFYLVKQFGILIPESILICIRSYH